MKFRGMVGLLTLMLFLALAGGGRAQEKGFLWDGNHWTVLSFEVKVGYMKGVCNLADYEAGNPALVKSDPIAWALVKAHKNKTIRQLIEEVDSYYKENPGKLGTPVLEVILSVP